MNAQASVSLDHILALLARLDLRIRREVVEFRMRQPQQDDEFRGLYISNEEVDGCDFLGRFFGVWKQCASGKGRERLRVRTAQSVPERDLLSA